MKTATALRTIRSFDPCIEAWQWCQTQTPEQGWRNCVRGDWMLWLISKSIITFPINSAERKKIVLCACECARLSLHLVPQNETRPLFAIETAEKWAVGDKNITIEMVNAAAYAAAADAAAYAAADAARAAAADAAAYAAACAADAADAAARAAAYAAACAADAADAAACAADAAATTLSSCANIVRKHYPKFPL